MYSYVPGTWPVVVRAVLPQSAPRATPRSDSNTLPVPGDEYVGWLNVAVNHPDGVDSRQTFADLLEPGQHMLELR